MGIGRLSLSWAPRSDVIVAAGLLLFGLVEALALAPAAPSWEQAGLTVAWTVPLAVRRRWPVAVLAIVMVCGPAITAFNEQGGVVSYVLSAVVASYTVGRELDPPATWWGPGLIGAVGSTFYAATREFIADLFFVALIYGGSWAAGQAAHRRDTRLGELARENDELVRDQRQRQESAVAEERGRIARELHDIIAHSISVIAIQSQAVRRRLGSDRPTEAAELQAIEATARDAMAEMRRLLGVLRADGERAALHPQPGLGQLHRLADELRDSGTDVAIEVAGVPVALTGGVDLAAYRIVQEALTNVRKHAANATAHVSITYTDDTLAIRVDNDGSTATATGGDGGHGLIGMRERVALYGGTLSAGPRDNGGFRVDARLPLTRTAPQ